MPTTRKTKEEPKRTLSTGHPEAGYVSPDLSTHEGTGTLPPEEVEWHEARNDAREEEVEAVTENEDKVARDEQKEAEKEAEKAADKAKADAESKPASTPPKTSA